MSEDIQNLIRTIINPDIQKLQAYQVADASNMIKLDAMENPYDLPSELKQAWLESLSVAELNRYPDPAAAEVCALLRDSLKLSNELDILLGNGSDELIQILIAAVRGMNRCVLSPEPGFVMYRLLSNIFGVEFRGVDLNSDFSLDYNSMLKAVEQYQPAIIFIAYPNNPTGNLFQREQIISLIQASTGLVVLDEAYQAFSSDSFINELDSYKNLLLLRTFSKTGLAGLRLGYLIGHQDWLNEFNKIRLPYNINVLTQASIRFLLNNMNELQQQAVQIKANRQHVYESLTAMQSLSVFPSEANFITFRTEQKDADSVHQALLQQSILIKKLHGAHPLLHNALRVTVGNETENQQFLQALADLLT